MLNIVVPMAGAGSRFASAGYRDPKPLIPVHGVPMIKLVVENLRPRRAHRFIFICQARHVADFGLRPKFSEWAPGCEIIELARLTEGAACTVLAARPLIDNDDALMIANSDQYVDCSIDDYLAQMEAHDLDGLIMTMRANDPKWSFVGIDQRGMVDRVVEKEVISEEATTGIYNFRHGRDFIAAAEAMIAAAMRVNGEFYVAPAYNQMLASSARVGFYNIGSAGAGMYGLGTPADLDHFLALPISHRLAKGVR